MEKVSAAKGILKHPDLVATLSKIETDITSGGTAASAGAGTDAPAAKKSTLTLPVLENYLTVMHDAEAWITSQETTSWAAYPWATTPQPLPFVEEQILGYDVPASRTLTDVLMDKVTQGVNFASPEIKDSLKRYRLDRLHRQMFDLHRSSGITMDNLYEFGLILASLLDNPDLETDKIEVQDRYNGLLVWFNGYDWLADSLEAQTRGVFSSPPPYIYTDDMVKALGVQDPAVIFEPSGHFGFHEMNKMRLRPDKHHRRYLLGIGFKGSVHGGSINGAVTRYRHDMRHGCAGEYGSQYAWRGFDISEFLLAPIFEHRDSLPEEQQRWIDFALYKTAVDDGLDVKTAVIDLPAGASQKDLGRTVIAATKIKNNPIGIFELGLDQECAQMIHPNLTDDFGANRDLKLRAEGDIVKGEIRYNIACTPKQTYPFLGTCIYDFTLPRSLKGVYTFTLREAKAEDSLTVEQKAQFDTVVAELSVADRPQNKVEHSPREFRIRRGDEVKSLHWLSTGKWVNPPQWRGPDAYTLDTMLWYKAGMRGVYDALLAKGLELWSDAPMPAETLDMLKTAAADM